MALFGKTKNKKEEKDVKKELQLTEEVPISSSVEIKGNWSVGGKRALKEFYVSEKASMLNKMNQYVFKVFNDTNKSEIKKQVEKAFDVKVKNIKVSNMPRKRRDIGKHPGFKSGFKKAVVILEEGYSIEQAKA